MFPTLETIDLHFSIKSAEDGLYCIVRVFQTLKLLLI